MTLMMLIALCSDENDFIVDDDGRPVSQGKKKRHIIHDDALVSAAHSVHVVLSSAGIAIKLTLVTVLRLYSH